MSVLFDNYPIKLMNFYIFGNWQLFKNKKDHAQRVVFKEQERSS